MWPFPILLFLLASYLTQIINTKKKVHPSIQEPPSTYPYLPKPKVLELLRWMHFVCKTNGRCANATWMVGGPPLYDIPSYLASRQLIASAGWCCFVLAFGSRVSNFPVSEGCEISGVSKLSSLIVQWKLAKATINEICLYCFITASVVGVVAVSTN